MYASFLGILGALYPVGLADLKKRLPSEAGLNLFEQPVIKSYSANC